MRSICLNFQVHQPYRLRTYRFFDMGESHYYYDDFLNRTIIRRIADKSYIPANKLFLDLIKKYDPSFRISFSLSGLAIEQMERYCPDAMDSFVKLSKTNAVEFLAETYSHSLASLRDKEEFISQVEKHARTIERIFGKRPVTFRNSELIYSDLIGETVSEMGYQTMLTEGAKHVLGWKSPNFLYCNAINPKLKLLLKNFQLSDDIAFRFARKDWAEWPLTTEKFGRWLNALDDKQEVVNIFIDYPALGERQGPETGIFEFIKALPATVLKHTSFDFRTPSEVSEQLQPISAVHVPFPISWADEERDVTAWLGNELQKEAVAKLYDLAPLVRQCQDASIQRDWGYLQASDHFYYMSTKWFSDGEVHKFFNPYSSPYEAFINYMNVLSDFIIRVENQAGQSLHPPIKTVVPEIKAPLPKKVVKRVKKTELNAKTGVKTPVKAVSVKKKGK
ncbi:MAG: glycoside hydrolase family 57 protein [Bacteroidetes bacterium]|nr:glycoside hydrolase family 57 protein [Bacteroidota bacterium]